MTIGVNYFDTSCLVKRYVNESGSREINRRFDNSELICTSNLAFAEFFAAIHRLSREGYLDTAGKRRILDGFVEDWQIMSIIALREEILHLIPGLIAKTHLTGADAVHLATAASLKSRGVNCLFVCSDLRLVHAAKIHRIKTFNPTE